MFRLQALTLVALLLALILAAWALLCLIRGPTSYTVPVWPTPAPVCPSVLLTASLLSTVVFGCLLAAAHEDLCKAAPATAQSAASLAVGCLLVASFSGLAYITWMFMEGGISAHTATALAYAAIGLNLSLGPVCWLLLHRDVLAAKREANRKAAHESTPVRRAAERAALDDRGDGVDATAGGGSAKQQGWMEDCPRCGRPFDIEANREGTADMEDVVTMFLGEASAHVRVRCPHCSTPITVTKRA